MRKLLITGASGFLGWHVCRRAARSWRIYGAVWTHPFKTPFFQPVRVDLTKAEDVTRIFEKVCPDAVIHTAAMADPEYCQQHPQAAYAINVDATATIARCCQARGIPLVFTSTDIVFDGLNPPYGEADPVSPVNIYGEQKVLAEGKIQAHYPRASICRLALMFGQSTPSSKSFLQPMLASLRRRQPIRLFEDEFRTPISGDAGAAGLLLALAKMPGILHLGGAQRISRYQFGCLVAKHYGLDPGLIMGGSQKNANMLALRPPDVSLDNRKACALGFRPPDLASELVRLQQRREWHQNTEREA